eukprot:TRINITY_DN22253_c0_g1_i1.p1 TRINITY_DN22253_c0_g1~~TRINITY_DN22253_c0_g1_i1.p1  ORF type:complete len:573 (+),score=55.34 TRINITY_DN22253_c0_g1_i1:39-1757(+)
MFDMRRQQHDNLKLADTSSMHTPAIIEVKWLVKQNGASTLVQNEDLDVIDKMREASYPHPLLKLANTDCTYILENMIGTSMLRFEDSFAEEVFVSSLRRLCTHKPDTGIVQKLSRNKLYCSCGMDTNLWMCLSCGFIACGRITSKEMHGGNGHMLQHFVENPTHIHSVRVGTLSPFGADIHCRTCQCSVQSQYTNSLLRRLGVDRVAQTKTSPTWFDLTKLAVAPFVQNNIHSGQLLNRKRGGKLFTLPVELLIHCASFISPVQALVSSLGSATVFLRNLAFQAIERNLHGLSLPSGKSGWQFFMNVDSPNLQYIKWSGVVAVKKHSLVLSQFPKLHTLILTNSTYEDGGGLFVALATHCNKLKVLSLSGSNLSLETSVAALEQHNLSFESVTALDLVDERYTKVGDSLSKLLPRIPQLEAIRLSCCLTDDLSKDLAAVSGLTTAEFTGIPVGWWSVPPSLLSCSKLVNLLLRPYNVSKEFISSIPSRLPLLQVLDVVSSTNNVSVINELLASMPSLLICVAPGSGLPDSRIMSPVRSQNLFSCSYLQHSQCPQRAAAPDNPVIKFTDLSDG